jgi:hypothetical protein
MRSTCVALHQADRHFASFLRRSSSLEIRACQLKKQRLTVLPSQEAKIFFLILPASELEESCS